MRRPLIALLFATCATLPLPVRAEGNPGNGFWKHWGDGRAEMNGYALTFPRYGELRQGTAVAIFVTETFSNDLRVKADPGKHRPSDEFPVMKLNLVRDFQTGVYDYNMMTSVFLALAPFAGDPEGRPAKISFSAQEWCGHAYEQLLFRNDVRRTLHSYFDGEADQDERLPYPADGVSEDALPLWARGWAKPYLRPGETRAVRLLESLVSARLLHKPANWTDARLSRSSSTALTTVPAGSFDTEIWTAELSGGRTRTFYVESRPPKRLIKWTTSEGEEAVLLGSDRMKYWEMNGNKYREALSKLGLETPGPGR